MKEILKKTFILFLSIITIFTISACGKNKDKKKRDKYVYNPEINYSDEMKDDMFEDVELQEVEIPNPDAFSNAFMDVEPTFTLQLASKGAYLTASEVNDSIYVRNAFEEKEEIVVEELVTGDFCGYSLSSKDGYKRGSAYTVSIEEAPNLLFLGKDESVRKVIFSVKDIDRDICTPKKNYKTYDIKKISYFSGYGDFDTYLLFDGSFDSKVGDVVIFDGAEDDEKIYIKVKKIEKNKSLYKIFYDTPSGDELFSELDLHVDSKPVDLEKDLHLKSKEEIKEEIKKSQLAEEFIAYAAYAYNFEDELMMTSKEFWDHVFIDISFRVQDNTFTTKISISFSFTLQTGWRVILFANFKYSETYVTSGGVRFDTFLGIPYHINMNVSLSSNVTVALEVRACLANPKFPKSWAAAQANPEQFSQRDAEMAKEELRESWAEGKSFAFMENQISGDTFMLGLGSITLRFFGWLAIDFEIYACIKNQLNITLGAGYTYSYTKTIVSYSSDTDRGDAASAPSKVSAHAINASFFGKYSAELYLKLRLSIYVTGFKWLLYLYVDVDGGIYLDIKGIASFTWDIGRGQVSGDGGVFLEFGLFIRVVLGVNILNLVNPNITLLEGKFPACVFDLSTCIVQRADSDTVEINQTITDVGRTTLLCYEVFDYNSLATSVKVLRPTDKVTYFRSVSKSETYDIFTDFRTDNPQIKVVGNNLVVEEGITEASATISFTYDTGLLKHQDSIRVHYVNSNAKSVTFDGQNKKLYLPGDKVEFPTTVPERPGYIFKGYKVNGELVNRMEDYIVGEIDINFESYYIVDETYTIRFYDHHNALITTLEVKNGDVIDEPIFIPKDNYDFICWDKDFHIANSDLNIYAICVKRGEL